MPIQTTGSSSSNHLVDNVAKSEVKQKSRIILLSSLIVLTTLGIMAAAGLFFAGVISSSIAIPLLLVLTFVFTGILAGWYATKHRLPRPSRPSKQPLQPPTKSYEHIFQLHFRTVPNLGEVSIGNVTASSTTLSYSIWRIPQTKTYLISAVGDITSPRFHTNLPNLMLVNAANADMLPGGGGTNLAFTSAVSSQGWANSTEGKRKLEVGECTAGKWENPDGTCNPQDSGLPNYLAQLLGPNATDCRNNLELCQQQAFKAYENCLHKGMSMNCHHIQLPLISSHNFAPVEALENERWTDAVKSSFVKAVVAFARRNSRYPMLIVIVNKDSPII